MPHVPRRPRGVLIAVMLLASLLLAGLLAFQAQRTFLHHRASAERVLRDYARLAASRFALRTGANLYYMAAWPPMEALLHTQAGARAPLPRPKRLAPGLKPYAAAVLEQARYTFRLDLATGRLETSGGAPSAAERAWLRDTLPVHARTVYQPEEHLAVMVGQVAGEPHAVMYTGMEKAGVQRTRVGVDVDPKAFEPFYTMGAEKQPLLPRPLTGGVVFDSLMSVVVTSADGAKLYHSPVQYAATFSARDTVEAMMGGMQVAVALRPELASKLVIGGLPRAPLVQEALEGFAPLAGARGVRLRSELAEGVVAPVDAEAFRQMLLNLLDNAVKYGPPGQVVTVGLAAGDRRARIWVDDQGPGIPAAARERVWDRFWRLERARGSPCAGTGIGLSVVRELVGLHGGRAWAEDGQSGTPPAGGRGVRFVIELPLEPSPQVAGQPGGLSSVPA